jgi:hypothetical protein
MDDRGGLAVREVISPYMTWFESQPQTVAAQNRCNRSEKSEQHGVGILWFHASAPKILW